MNPEYIVAGVTAATLTLFDLDRTFYLPAKMQEKAKMWAWYWGFVIANGLLASALLGLVDSMGLMKDMNPLLRGLVVGASFLAIIRAKFTSFELDGKTVPFGLELLYNAARQFASRPEPRLSPAIGALEEDSEF